MRARQLNSGCPRILSRKIDFISWNLFHDSISLRPTLPQNYLFLLTELSMDFSVEAAMTVGLNHNCLQGQEYIIYKKKKLQPIHKRLLCLLECILRQKRAKPKKNYSYHIPWAKWIKFLVYWLFNFIFLNSWSHF